MSITLTAPTSCPQCGHRITAASHVDDNAPMPQPGDYTICLYCSTLLIFADDLAVRNLTDAEMIEAVGNKEMMRTMKFTHEYQQWRAKQDENKG